MILAATDMQRVRCDLNSSVISDTMDSLGYLNQALNPEIRPLDEGEKLFGRARTAKIEALAPAPPRPDNPFELTIKMMDDLGVGDVVVRACAPEARNGVTWGELLTTAAMARGAVGLVTDGLVRDVDLIREVGFPVFSGGISPVDGGGRHEMVAADIDVVCGGIPIRPGDYIFGDVDGIVVVPVEIIEVTIKGAFEKTKGENNTRRELLEGRSLSDVYKKYGIL